MLANIFMKMLTNIFIFMKMLVQKFLKKFGKMLDPTFTLHKCW
jgi:hypothetical protein